MNYRNRLLLTFLYPISLRKNSLHCLAFSIAETYSPLHYKRPRSYTSTSCKTLISSTARNIGTSSQHQVLPSFIEEDPIMSTKDFQFRVVSYNILSSHLASPTHHTKCDPEQLQSSTRLPKILNKLQEELDTSNVKNEPVIFCLQEVSHDWAAALHTFFAQRKYHLVTALYGKKFNGYMGIATAFPMDKFETLQVDLCRLSDKKKGGWPRAPPEPEPGFMSKYIFKPLMKPIVSTVHYLRGNKPAAEDPWDYSQWRFNQFIGIKLKPRDKNTVFWVGNYHMPCAFRTPAVMNIHADLVSDRIQTLAGSDEYILAGDFNILPDSPHYKLLRTGKLDENDETYPPPKYGVTWESSFQGMKSAYYEFDGKEPVFTNNAHNGALNAESFIGTLDYIFLSENVKVLGVKDTPSMDNWKGVYPDENEPSDHVLIAASLRL